jgi:hypothetical protein
MLHDLSYDFNGKGVAICFLKRWTGVRLIYTQVMKKWKKVTENIGNTHQQKKNYRQ